ncbi:Actin domain containing protein [Elaphomyces granulatus]
MAAVSSSSAPIRSSMRQTQAAQQTTPSSPHTPQQQQRSLLSSFGGTASPVPSFRNEEDSVILEFGSRWLRAGFEGESSPMCVVGFGPEESRKAGDYRGWVRNREDDNIGHRPQFMKAEDWTRDLELWRMDIRDLDLGLVEDKIERAIREIYNKYLLTDAGSSRLVLVLPSIIPHPLLSTVLTTLFNRWRYPSISLLPSATMATAAAGLRSALVVDLGWEETIITGVYEYRELKIGRSIRAMRLLVQEMGKMLTKLANKNSHDKIPEDGVSVRLEYCEEVVCRLAWCKLNRENDVDSTRLDQDPTILSDRASGQVKQGSFPSGTVMISVPSPGDPNSSYMEVPLLSFAEPVERALFAVGFADCDLDDHDKPIQMLIYNTLLALPPDVRGSCMSRIIFTGGGSKIVGIRQRVMTDVESLVQRYGWSAVRGTSIDQQRQKLQELSINQSHRVQSQTVSSPSHPSSARSSAEPSTQFAKGDEELDFVEQKLRRGNKDAKPFIQGVFRQVDSLGAWAGASLVTSLKTKGLVEIEREKYLQHGLAGASRDLDSHHHHVVDRRSGFNPSTSRPGGDRSSWSLGGWA